MIVNLMLCWSLKSALVQAENEAREAAALAAEPEEPEGEDKPIYNPLNLPLGYELTVASVVTSLLTCVALQLGRQADSVLAVQAARAEHRVQVRDLRRVQLLGAARLRAALQGVAPRESLVPSECVPIHSNAVACSGLRSNTACGAWASSSRTSS